MKSFWKLKMVIVFTFVSLILLLCDLHPKSHKLLNDWMWNFVLVFTMILAYGFIFWWEYDKRTQMKKWSKKS